MLCGFHRDGYKVFFDHLEEQQVPLLIFSAGVGDVLEEVIQQNSVFHPNIRIISNYMDFDQAVSCTALGSTLPTKMLRLDDEIESRPVNTLFPSS